MAFTRPYAALLAARLAEPPRMIQIVAGPRQVGKSTLVRDVLFDRPIGSYLSVDAQAKPRSADAVDEGEDAEAKPRLADAVDGAWLEAQWRLAERKACEWQLSGHPRASALSFILVVDEIQFVPQWSTTVKGLWDAAKARGTVIHVVLLGSAPLLVQQGLNESLTGRFELLRIPHWSFTEMTQCFGMALDQYLYFGGYPGSAPFFEDEQRWRAYVRGSLIEPSIERDVLAMARVDAPATLRRLFELGAEYSAQILALDRVRRTLGEGHVLTLAHHLTLLGHAGLLTGLQKYAAQTIRQRQSPPKFQVLNNALFSAQGTHRFAEAKADRSRWGRLVESAVGAHLLNTADHDTRVYYWRESSLEVDFVVEHRGQVAAIEVKSQGASRRHAGLDEFCRRHPQAKRWSVGGEALPLGEFFIRTAADWVK